MLVAMIVAALAIDGLFSALHLIPDTRPARSDIFSSVKVDYKLVLNILGLAIFAALFGLTMRRGATDPACGMKIDRAKAVRERTSEGTAFFCSEDCRDAYVRPQADASAVSTTAGYS
jgi:YHS domain-containing protein